jgi:hypothetical protein
MHEEAVKEHEKQNDDDSNCPKDEGAAHHIYIPGPLNPAQSIARTPTRPELREQSLRATPVPILGSQRTTTTRDTLLPPNG